MYPVSLGEADLVPAGLLRAFNRPRAWAPPGGLSLSLPRITVSVSQNTLRKCRRESSFDHPTLPGHPRRPKSSPCKAGVLPGPPRSSVLRCSGTSRS